MPTHCIVIYLWVCSKSICWYIRCNMSTPHGYFIECILKSHQFCHAINVAELKGIKYGNFNLPSQQTKNITLGTGLLIVIARGSQYGAAFFIDYWTQNVNKISSSTGQNYISVTKESKTKDVSITNLQNVANSFYYIFLG